ncbi:hypothetical protein Agub_g7995 [Astrephomene gubernaculifera]|uniref:C2 domain-containing protein n=1 Tax=Astrephomene gubernaculifera TaxID=47775 RepID=A0AAD3HMR9_9CHLO|nr:hypothetical protein Agub_g7995 [Astrephomene gubernaculifera]
MAGKLCVSVIEARNVQADEFAEKNFYVKLRVGSNEVKTDVVRGSLQPKFLKDCRLAIANQETDVLRIELLQVGPRGDLVVGCDELRVLSLTARGTIVHWFQLKTAARSVTAELCLVLRFLSATSNRPMSPTYAITARQAKERALEGSASAPQGPSAAAFRDLPASTSSNGRSTAGPAPAAAAAAANGHTSSNGHAGPAAAGMTSSAPQQQQQQQRLQSTASSSGRPGAAGGGAGAAGGAGGGAPRRPLKLSGSQVPLPLAMLGGIVVGALVYIWKQRPVYYEVQEDDTLCHIASCFKKRVEDVYRRNRALLKNPNRLYPGDRLRIK